MNQDLDEYLPLTRKQSMQFWGAFAGYMAFVFVMLLIVNYGAHHGWYA